MESNKSKRPCADGESGFCLRHERSRPKYDGKSKRLLCQYVLDFDKAVKKIKDRVAINDELNFDDARAMSNAGGVNGVLMHSNTVGMSQNEKSEIHEYRVKFIKTITEASVCYWSFKVLCDKIKSLWTGEKKLDNGETPEEFAWNLLSYHVNLLEDSLNFISTNLTQQGMRGEMYQQYCRTLFSMGFVRGFLGDASEFGTTLNSVEMESVTTSWARTYKKIWGIKETNKESGLWLVIMDEAITCDRLFSYYNDDDGDGTNRNVKNQRTGVFFVI